MCDYPHGTGDPSQCQNPRCPSGWNNLGQPEDESPVSGFEYEKRPDGTFLVGFKGNIHHNHWHLAPDGTVLSVKEGGHHLFQRHQMMQNIRTVCPQLNISFLWEG